MSRKNESNQKAALRSAFGQFLRENDVIITISHFINVFIFANSSTTWQYLLFLSLHDACFHV